MYNFQKRKNLFTFIDDNDVYSIYRAQNRLGTLKARKENDIVYFDLNSSLRNKNQMLKETKEFLIKEYKPKKLIIRPTVKTMFPYLKNQGFYPIGLSFQYIVDPYRLVMNDKVFDEEGFIIDQGKLEIIPYGLFNSKDKGCGWIATYNLMHALDKNPRITDILSSLTKYDPLFEALGTSIFTINRYLKEKGIKLNYTIGSNKKIASTIENSTHGILLYYHRHGAHFTMYRRLKSGKYEFFNVVYGRKVVMSPVAFMKKYTFIKACQLIYMK